MISVSFKSIFVLFLLAGTLCVTAQKKNTAIYSGVPWFDDKGNTVSAHGANPAIKQVCAAIGFAHDLLKVQFDLHINALVRNRRNGKYVS